VACLRCVLRLVAVGAAEPALLGALSGSVVGTARTVAEEATYDVGFVFEFTPQDRSLRLDSFAPPLQLRPALVELLQPCRPVGAFQGLLGLAGGAGEYALRSDVHVSQLDALIGQ
jgi:hypothetical protein